MEVSVLGVKKWGAVRVGVVWVKMFSVGWVNRWDGGEDQCSKGQ